MLATQTLPQARPKTMAVTVNGSLPDGVTAKDLVLTLIAHTGTGGGQGYIVEYRGPAIEALSMEARMTVCNMSIEWGAKAGLIAPDQTTFDYIEGRPEAPKGADWDAAVAHWKTPASPTTTPTSTRRSCSTPSHDDAVRHLGHQPRPGRAARRRACPTPTTSRSASDRDRRREGAGVHGPRGRHADARDQGRHRLRRLVHQRPDRGPARWPPRSSRAARSPTDTRLLVVPGSVRVRLQAEDEGLDVVFKEAGAEWRGAGCSMCLGMNPDQLAPRERSASTSNRNFEGRQGKGGRTHLVSVPGRRRHRRPRHAVVARPTCEPTAGA